MTMMYLSYGEHGMYQHLAMLNELLYNFIRYYEVASSI